MHFHMTRVLSVVRKWVQQYNQVLCVGCRATWCRMSRNVVYNVAQHVVGCRVTWCRISHNMMFDIARNRSSVSGGGEGGGGEGGTTFCLLVLYLGWHNFIKENKYVYPNSLTRNFIFPMNNCGSQYLYYNQIGEAVSFDSFLTFGYSILCTA